MQPHLRPSNTVGVRPAAKADAPLAAKADAAMRLLLKRERS